MRRAVWSIALLLAATSVTAQLGDIEVPVPIDEVPVPADPTSGLPLPEDEPPAQSKDPEDPPHDYQTVMWTDARSAPLPDGFDLIELRTWEVDMPGGGEAQGPGLMIRLHVAGADAAGLYDQHLVVGSVYRIAEEPTIANITLVLDDTGWWVAEEGLVLLDATSTGGQDVVPEMLQSSADHVLHLFMPLSAVAAAPGDELGGWAFYAQGQASDDSVEAARFDSAPGEAIVIRNADDLANASIESKAGPVYFVQGAGHHLEVDGDWDSGIASFTVHNPYQYPQEVRALYPASASPMGETKAMLEGNATAIFQFNVPQSSAPKSMEWWFRSDIHALARMQLDLPALPAPPADPADPPAQTPPVEIQRTDVVVKPPAAEPQAPAPEPSGDDDAAPAGEDSPIGVWLALMAVAVAAAARRIR